MDTAQQPATVNGRRHALRTGDNRLTVDGRVRVFNATLDDADALICLLEAVHYESPQLSAYDFDREQTENSVIGMLARTETDTVALIAYRDGTPIGCMGAMIVPQMTTKTLVASELLLYVEPAHRGTRAALMLVRAFEKWAQPYDMRAGSSLGIDDDKAINFYSRLGYTPDSIGVGKRGLNNV